MAKSFPKFHVLGILALSLICCRPQKTSEGPTTETIEYLRTFAKAYGYVRYFHPSDEASSIDWNLFALHGAEEVAKCSSGEELLYVLDRLFRPIAPTIVFHHKDSVLEYDFSKIVPDDAHQYKPTFWQHFGLGPRKQSEDVIYQSVRTNRDKFRESIRPFNVNLEYGELIEKEIGDNIVCQMPLVLYSDKDHTFPKADENSLSQLQSKLKGIRPNASELNLRLGNVINLFNIIQHFFPYMDDLDLDWEEELKTALKRSYQDQSRTDHISTLLKLTAPLKDGHVGFSSATKSPTFEAGWEMFLLPIGWEWIEDKLVITKVYDEGLPIKAGDIVSAIDHKGPREFFEKVHSKISAGTQGWLDYRSMTLSLSGKKDSEILLTVNDRDIPLKYGTPFYDAEQILSPYIPDRLYINDSVTYINISSFSMEGLDEILGRLQKSKSIIFDARDYPHSSALKFISYLLKENDTANGYMKVPKIVYPDQENVEYEAFELKLKAEEPYLGDKQIIFITGARAISYSETIMTYIKGYKLATIIGQPTAGTDGNANTTQLAGEITFRWTGMKMTNLDGSRLYGVGVLPDIYIDKTIEGFKAGKDEFLEKAIELTKN